MNFFLMGGRGWQDVPFTIRERAIRVKNVFESARLAYDVAISLRLMTTEAIAVQESLFKGGFVKMFPAS
jgi:hypothetical protein